MRKTFYFLPVLALLLIGCSASEVTEEYTEEKQDVTYKTEQPAPVTEDEVQIPTQPNPEYIPQGPPNPPPPPVKVHLSTPSSEKPETKVEETPPLVSEIYQYKVQVFAFKSKLNAETEVRKLKKRLPNQNVFVEYENNLYKVRLGAYSKWEHAKGIKDALYNLGYVDSFIITEVRK